MKILLQDANTGLYLGRGKTWCENPHAALAFLDEIRARDFVVYHHLGTAQVVALTEAGESAIPATTQRDNLTPTMKPESIPVANSNTGKPRRSAKRNGQKPKQGASTLTGTSNSDSAKGLRKTASRKSRPTRPASAPEEFTVVEAKIDVGLGNALFIRGQGDGLSWDKGKPLSCVDTSTWVWVSAQARDKIVFKLLLNDQIWAKGDDMVVKAGRKLEFTPVF